MIEEDFIAITPVNFVQIRTECHYVDPKKSAELHPLPETYALCDEELRALMESSGYESRQYFSYLSSSGEHVHFFEFDGSNPGRHINYWDLEKLLTVCHDIGFSQVLPNYQGASVAKPFHNLSVFDNTEPQISFYVDIIK